MAFFIEKGERIRMNEIRIMFLTDVNRVFEKYSSQDPLKETELDDLINKMPEVYPELPGAGDLIRLIKEYLIERNKEFDLFYENRMRDEKNLFEKLPDLYDSISSDPDLCNMLPKYIEEYAPLDTYQKLVPALIKSMLNIDDIRDSKPCASMGKDLNESAALEKGEIQEFDITLKGNMALLGGDAGYDIPAIDNDSKDPVIVRFMNTVIKELRATGQWFKIKAKCKDGIKTELPCRKEIDAKGNILLKVDFGG